jgi:hypothetical protein
MIVTTTGIRQVLTRGHHRVLAAAAPRTALKCQEAGMGRSGLVLGASEPYALPLKGGGAVLDRIRAQASTCGRRRDSSRLSTARTPGWFDGRRLLRGDDHGPRGVVGRAPA